MTMFVIYLFDIFLQVNQYFPLIFIQMDHGLQLVDKVMATVVYNV